MTRSAAALLALGLLLAGPHADLGAGEAQAAPEPVRAYVVLQEPGAWHLPAADLKAHGLPDPSEVEVLRAGRPVPSMVAEDGVVFLASTVAGPHSRAGLYQVRRRSGPAPAPAYVHRPGSADGERPVRAGAEATWAQDAYHGDLAAGPHEVYGVTNVPTWFLAPLDPQVTAKLENAARLALPAVADGRLLVRVYATHPGPVRLRAIIDDEGLGPAEAPHAVGGATLVYDVPAAVLATAKRVRLVDESPPLPAPAKDDVTRAYGRLWIDALRTEAVVEGDLEARTAPWTLLAVPEHELPAPTEPGYAAVERDGHAIGSAFAWTAGLVPGPAVNAGDRVIATGPARAAPRLVAAPELPDPVALARGAAHVIVATPPLVEAAQVLAAHRTAQGLPSVVVPSGAIWWHLGAGEASPAALRTFVRALLADSPSTLRYLVLAGDATYDRVDLTDVATIPTPMARTKYNGATSSDRFYGRPLDDADAGGVPVGRLPFRDAKRFASYVERLVRYETSPGPDPTRRLLRFVTSEGRFGALVDGMLELAFRQVIARDIPEAYDLEVTYANLRSSWLWPPRRFADKVVDDLSEGSLFFTYVGHGFEKGFDRLRVGREAFPILDMEAVKRVDVHGTPPVVLVLACTTAMFDGMRGPGVDEALLSLPSGPIACWGATRDSHPAANTLLGMEMAVGLGKATPGTRLGDLLQAASDRAVRGEGGAQLMRAALRLLSTQGYDLDPERLAIEASWMYTLLGDPAMRLALVPRDVEIAVQAKADGLAVAITAPAADGAKVVVRRQRSRAKPATLPPLGQDPASPDAEEAIMARHAEVNDLTLVEVEGTLAGGRCEVVLPGPAEKDETVQVIVRDATSLHHGGITLTADDVTP